VDAVDLVLFLQGVLETLFDFVQCAEEGVDAVVEVVVALNEQQ
jgi:hypothetical protein